MSDSAKIQCEGHELEFPIVEGTEQEKAIDISALRKQSGLITIDEGYVNTGSTRSCYYIPRMEKQGSSPLPWVCD